MSGSHWTPERETHLRKIVAEGGELSADNIGRLVGVSRNAVIGKCNRLKLVLPGAACNRLVKVRKHTPTDHTSHNLIAQKCARARKVRAATRPKPGLVPVLPATEAADLPPEIVPADQRKTLYELTGDTCRWPIGDPMETGFHFCGAAPKTGHPYCAGHCRMAYETRAQRRDRLAAWKADQKTRAA